MVKLSVEKISNSAVAMSAMNESAVLENSEKPIPSDLASNLNLPLHQDAEKTDSFSQDRQGRTDEDEVLYPHGFSLFLLALVIGSCPCWIFQENSRAC